MSHTAQAFRDRKGKVLVVDPSGSGRTMMADVVRKEGGFAEVEGKPSVEEVIRHLEIDQALWVITPLLADQAVNALHLVKLCTQAPELRSVRVSLLLDDGEDYVIPAAFELGAFTWHHRGGGKDAFGEEIRGVMQLMESLDFNDSLIAADFLKRHYRAAGDYQAELALAKSVLGAFPGNAKALLAMATPQFKLGQRDQAKKTLSSVKMLEPRLADQVDVVAKELFGDGTPKIPVAGDIEASDLNYLGASTCVVIDPDETVGTAVAEIVKKLGCADVQTFCDGPSAIAHLEKTPEPHLIIMEWRIPKLAAPMVLQRIRSMGYLSAPIVVLSSLLKPADMPLVKEMGVAAILSKPLNKDLFIPGLIAAMQQERAPTEASSLERKIRLHLAAGRKDEAAVLRQQLLSDPQAPAGKKKLIDAEWAFAHGNYAQARDLGAEALKMTGDGYLVLNLLGKAFMRLADYQSAIKCFQKAQQMSPNNLERLCNIAETQAELDQEQAAKETLDQAIELDENSKTVSEAQVKVALSLGDADKAKAMMGELESLASIVAYMNNKAVAHAKCDLTDEAIEIYRNTVKSIPDDKTETRAIVQYNMALALAKANDLEAAKAETEAVLALNVAKIAKKAKSLHERLKASLATGTTFKLNADPSAATPPPQAAAGEAAPPVPEEDPHAVLARVEIKQGDLCCFMIYNAPSGIDARAESLFAKPPRFQRRAAIAREEAMGDARLAKEA